VALATAAVGSLLMTSGAFAQSSQIVRVDTPTNGFAGLGNFTTTGVAVDCATGQAPSRVAVYDGNSSSGNYIADVSIETMVNVATVCSGRSGNAQIGWRLIFDSRRLSDGNHTLTFVAQFGNQTATTALDVFVGNNPPRNYNNVPAVVTGGGYWVNGYYYPNPRGFYASVPPAVYTNLNSQCMVFAANGVCLQYIATYAGGVYPACTYVYGCRPQYDNGFIVWR
jgi:hypothetical protein